MKKKIVIGSILTIFLLLAISYATAVSVSPENNKKKESPLFAIRTERKTYEKVETIIENIKVNFLGERLFFLPFKSLILPYENGDFRINLEHKDSWNCPSSPSKPCSAIHQVSCLIHSCPPTQYLKLTCYGSICDPD